MQAIEHILSNYKGSRGFEYWPEELRKKRMSLYLTDEEREQIKTKNDRYPLYIALIYAKELCRHYSFQSLQDAYKQLSEARFSTQLTGIAKELAQRHKQTFKTIKIEKVKYPVQVALRNYKAYLEADQEDQQYLAGWEKELDGYKKEYLKDYPAYKAKRDKAMIPVHLEVIKST